jgi:formylglycine-generating enzyme required for sulfatase activity
MSGCENIAKFTEVATGEEANPRTTISFAGIDSIDSVTDTTATIHWSEVSGASAYQIFSVNGNELSYVTTVSAPNSSYLLTGLTPSSTTTYRVRLVDSQGRTDANTKDITITTNAVPDTPSSLTLTSPAGSPDFQDYIVVEVDGVKAGDTVKLFSDSSCSTEIGSATVSTDDGSSVSITSTTLTAGNYSIYANATDPGGSSGCSSVSISYEKKNCPDGYIMVPANSTVGVDRNFCVMKYEAKMVDGNPASVEAGKPWVSINQTNARNECRSLNSETGDTNINADTNSDGTYDLISNPEWMAIARNVENVAENWTGGAVGDGCLKRGNIGGTYNCTGSNGSVASGYNGADPDDGSARENYNGTAELVLSNGESIFDFSGNVWEWVDWTLGGGLSTNMASGADGDKPYIDADGAPVSAWRELSALDHFTAHSPVTAILPSDSTFNADQGMGKYYAGTSGGAAIRGGRWNRGTNAGAFALALNHSSSYSYTNIGFRCVFRLLKTH